MRFRSVIFWLTLILVLIPLKAFSAETMLLSGRLSMDVPESLKPVERSFLETMYVGKGLIIDTDQFFHDDSQASIILFLIKASDGTDTFPDITVVKNRLALNKYGKMNLKWHENKVEKINNHEWAVFDVTFRDKRTINKDQILMHGLVDGQLVQLTFATTDRDKWMPIFRQTMQTLKVINVANQ